MILIRGRWATAWHDSNRNRDCAERRGEHKEGPKPAQRDEEWSSSGHAQQRTKHPKPVDGRNLRHLSAGLDLLLADEKNGLEDEHKRQGGPALQPTSSLSS